MKIDELKRYPFVVNSKYRRNPYFAYRWDNKLLSKYERMRDRKFNYENESYRRNEYGIRNKRRRSLYN